MKRFINVAFAYAVAAIAGGVFFREFTKFNGFTGTTQLSFLHVHLFVLGMCVFLLAAVFEKLIGISKGKKFRAFFVTYNIGVVFTVCVMVWHGILQVFGMAGGAMVAGIAGIGHIILTAGLVLLFLLLRDCASQAE